MKYITRSNAMKVLRNIDARILEQLEGEIYKKDIYFFSRKEKQKLLGYKEFVQDPVNFCLEYYVPLEKTGSL